MYLLYTHTVFMNVRSVFFMLIKFGMGTNTFKENKKILVKGQYYVMDK